MMRPPSTAPIIAPSNPGSAKKEEPLAGGTAANIGHSKDEAVSPARKLKIRRCLKQQLRFPPCPPCAFGHLALGVPAVLGGLRAVHGGGVYHTALEYGAAVTLLAALALAGIWFNRARIAPA